MDGTVVPHAPPREKHRCTAGGEQPGFHGMTAEPPKPFSTIVVGFDGMSQGVDALHLAQALADPESEIVVCCVYPLEVGEHGTAKRDDAEGRLRVGRALLGARPNTRFTVRPAFSPGAGLHEEVEEAGAQLLVVGSSHRGKLGRIVPGSVTRQALHAAPCAVAVAPLWLQSHEPIAFGAIGVGYDGLPAAHAALDRAAALARARRARLRVLCVVEPPGAGWASSWAFPPPPSNEDRDAAVRETEQVVAGLAANGLEASVQILDGSPASELVAASSELDLLVLGSRAYGPIRRALLGTVSGGVTEAAACPVLVVPRSTELTSGSRRLRAVTAQAATFL
jgi:nucleotide-binding universal stress UspA family protein